LFEEDVLNLITTKNFILIGQSFGAIVGLKLAALLEAHGKVGYFGAVDGSPEWSFKITKQIINSSDSDLDEIFQTWTIKFFIKIAFMGEAKAVMEQVFKKQTWNEKLEALYELVQTRFSFSFHYFKTLLVNAVVIRTRMTHDIYDFTLPVLKETRITLFRASEVIIKDIGEDYGLEKQSLQPFTNKVVDGTHVTIISNPRLPELINKMFVPSNK
jgi:fatty acid synthase, animal type